MLKQLMFTIKQWLRIWGWYLTAFLIPVLYLLIYEHTHALDVLHKTLTPNDTDMTNDAVIAIIVTGIASMIAYLKNPVLQKKNDALSNKITDFMEVNLTQHNEIKVNLNSHTTAITNITKILEKTKAEDIFRESLHKIRNDALEYSIGRNNAQWISSEAKDFFQLFQDTLDGGINCEQMTSFKAAINVRIAKSNSITKDYLGDEFFAIIGEQNKILTLKYRDDIIAIMKDKFANSKIDRFRDTSKMFLREYFTSNVKGWLRYSKDTKA